MSRLVVLIEGVLNDDTLEMADEGKIFLNGHVRGKFMVTHWTFANEWCNHKHQFIAKTFANAVKRYEKETKVKFTEDEKIELEFALTD